MRRQLRVPGGDLNRRKTVMKACLVSFVCAVFAALCLPAAPQAGRTQSASCDRACLNGMLDDYVAALKAHDPSRLPLAENVRFTENNVPLAIGDGLWNTVDAIGAYRLPFLEPETGQAGLFGVVEENGKPAHLLLRLKVDSRRITEIETIVLRPQANNGFGRPQDMKQRAAFYEDVSADQQLSRIQLASIANSCFETLQQNHGVVFAPFAPTCHRIENGVATTNNPAPTTTGRPDEAGIKKMGCEAQFKTGFFAFVTRIRDRRFVVVDRQKGLVYAAAFFDHRGDMRKVTLTNGRVADAQYDTPWTWQIGELFKIKDGKIDQIEALVMYAPYGSQDAWSERSPCNPTRGGVLGARLEPKGLLDSLQGYFLC
jgi:hypothetical protein